MTRDRRTALRRARRHENPGGVISNEIILDQLYAFLEGPFPGYRDLLDIGAGTRPYAPIYEERFSRCVAVDVPHSQHDLRRVDALAPAESLPFADQSFDSVICTEVLEHCADPRAAIGEIARVLRPTGRAFISTPFLRPLHEQPHDYHRFTPWGLAELARDTQLELISIVPRGEYLAVLLMTALLPVGKSWIALDRLTDGRVNAQSAIAHGMLVLPQRGYFAAWKALRRRARVRPLYEKLSYYTLGYVTVARRPHSTPVSRSTEEVVRRVFHP